VSVAGYPARPAVADRRSRGSVVAMAGWLAHRAEGPGGLPPGGGGVVRCRRPAGSAPKDRSHLSGCHVIRRERPQPFPGMSTPPPSRPAAAEGHSVLAQQSSAVRPHARAGRVTAGPSVVQLGGSVGGYRWLAQGRGRSASRRWRLVTYSGLGSATPAWAPMRLPSSDQAALTASRRSWPSSTRKPSSHPPHCSLLGTRLFDVDRVLPWPASARAVSQTC